MLEYLRGRVSECKLRLFGCAVCRRVWQLLTDKRSQKAVEVAERYADEEATVRQLRRAADAARQASFEAGDVLGDPRDPDAAEAACAAASDYADESALQASAFASRAAAYEAVPSYQKSLFTEAEQGERSSHCYLLRDLAGNPFRPLPRIEASVLTWKDGTAKRLAEDVYEQRVLPSGYLDPARLSVLADALEEAGCTDSEVLGHLRGPGSHVRGCWVLDWLLGKA